MGVMKLINLVENIAIDVIPIHSILEMYSKGEEICHLQIDLQML